MDHPYRPSHGDPASLAGICGLYCGDCPYYLAHRLDDQETETAIAAAFGLALADSHCDGCLSDKVAAPCRDCSQHGFRTCALEHSVIHCHECSEFPCERLENFSKLHVVNGLCHHERVIDDLKAMAGIGPAAWAAGQAGRSDCPACGRPGYWYSRICPDCGAKIR